MLPWNLWIYQLNGQLNRINYLNLYWSVIVPTFHSFWNYLWTTGSAINTLFTDSFAWLFHLGKLFSKNLFLQIVLWKLPQRAWRKGKNLLFIKGLLERQENLGMMNWILWRHFEIHGRMRNWKMTWTWGRFPRLFPGKETWSKCVVVDNHHSYLCWNLDWKEVWGLKPCWHNFTMYLIFWKKIFNYLYFTSTVQVIYVAIAYIEIISKLLNISLVKDKHNIDA